MNKLLAKIIFSIVIITSMLSAHASGTYIAPINGYSLDKQELEYHNKQAELDNINSQVILAKYYQYARNNGETAIYWYERAAKSGDIDSMIDFSSWIIRRSPERIDHITYEYLKLATSLGDDYSKLMLAKLCMNYKKCKYSVIDELIELSLRDPSEHAYNLLCYLKNDNVKLSKNQSSAILATMNFHKEFINEKRLCWSDLEESNYFSYLVNHSNPQLTKSIEIFLKKPKNSNF